MKLRGKPKGHHNNVYQTNHFASGSNLIRTMRRRCSEDVSWALAGEAGRQR